MQKLDYFCEKDPRIKKVYEYAKEKYNEEGREQHNFQHALRDLYRALKIAETEEDVNYEILIPSVILHDIGATEEDYKKHEEIGPKIAKRDLPEFGYSEEEIEEIAHCIRTHSGRKKPETLEAKILHDSDKLEKCGIGGIYAFYRVQTELDVPIENTVDDIEEHLLEKTKKRKEEGFHTEKASEICGDGFQQRIEHAKKVLENLEERKDFLVQEKDLWD